MSGNGLAMNPQIRVEFSFADGSTKEPWLLAPSLATLVPLVGDFIGVDERNYQVTQRWLDLSNPLEPFIELVCEP
jgi:hypothetical protein